MGPWESVSAAAGAGQLAREAGSSDGSAGYA